MVEISHFVRNDNNLCHPERSRGISPYILTISAYLLNKGEENKEPHILLTNGHIKKSREIRRRVMGYYHRWGVEECYRFEKQGFGIEKSLTPNFNAIKSLLGASMLAWSVLLMVQEDEELKEQAIANSKREKTKKKDRPKFIYYSLLDGISRAFIMAKEIFRFRKPKPPKLAPTIVAYCKFIGL